MADCPYCAAALQRATLGAHDVQACPACGGLWVAADHLTAAAQAQPGALAAFADQWPDRGGRPPKDHPHSLCAGCGQRLVGRKFAAAPGLIIESCAACRQLFLTAGQQRQLHHILRSGPAPAAAPVAEADAAVEVVEAEENLWADFLFRLRWPERDTGQNRLSWLVLGLPQWALLLLIVAAAWCDASRELAAAKAIPDWIAAYAAQLMPGLLGGQPTDIGAAFQQKAMYLLGFWPIYTIIATAVVHLVWARTDEGAPLGFGDTFLLLLRVCALKFCLDAVIKFAFQGSLSMAVVVWVLISAIDVVLYRYVLELSWREVVLLIFYGMMIGGRMTL